jgi:glycosyltransferase involved in cell wall biosynthesis
MNLPARNEKKIRIVFLIRSLYFGGAERQLLTLVNGLNKVLFDPIILCFYQGGELEAEFVKTGVPVIALEKKGRWDVFLFLFRLIKQIQILDPDILHSYLSMSNILAVLIKIIVRKTRIVFGVRYAYMDLTKYDWLTRLVYKLEIFLSRFADLIIVNSYTGKRNHIKNGFASNQMIVIPNGIDTTQFYPSSTERLEFRAKLGITAQNPLVGLVGRLDPVKDHSTFLKAAVRVLSKRPQVNFICVGDGDPAYHEELKHLTQCLGISEKIIWLEGQKNVRAVYNALDVCCSTSVGESFSNVIAEAMACSLPCVVTDVGDSALIVEKSGVVVPVGDSQALAEGINKVLSLTAAERLLIGVKGKQRIEKEFSVLRMIERTEKVLINLNQGILTE